MNGLYLQLHAYMLRIAIPYGTLSTRQLRRLAWVAKTYDKGYGHFTTRTNLQLHWIKLRDAPDVMDALAEVDLHGIQTSGNCIRNVTADPYAGATADEVDDPRVWAEVIRQWSTVHPEFSYLPRKFKHADTAPANDRTAAKSYDIGLQLRRGRDGALSFEVMVGGGQGRTPYLAKTIREHLPVDRLLSYLEAIIRVYNRHGRRDNIHKARIKILVNTLGAEEFARQVEAEWAKIDGAEADLPDTELARIRGAFHPHAFQTLPPVSKAFEAARAQDAGFARFARRNVHPHKVAGYAIVDISLKAPGETPGDCSAEQMELVADLADRYALGEVRVNYTQNLVLPHVKLDDLPDLYAALKAAGLATANIDLVSDIIACPGLDYCSAGQRPRAPFRWFPGHRPQVRRPRAGRADRRAEGQDFGLHQRLRSTITWATSASWAWIRRARSLYQISLRRLWRRRRPCARRNTGSGRTFFDRRGRGCLEALVNTYLSLRREGERFLDTFRRTGLAPFKEAIYADAD